MTEEEKISCSAGFKPGEMEFCPLGYPGPQCEIGFQGPQSCPCPYCEECRESRWWLKDKEEFYARTRKWLRARPKQPWELLPPRTDPGRPREILGDEILCYL